MSMYTHSKKCTSGTDTLATLVSATHFLCLRKLKCQLSQMGKEMCMYLTVPAYSPFYLDTLSKQRGKDREITPSASFLYRTLEYIVIYKDKCIWTTIKQFIHTCVSHLYFLTSAKPVFIGVAFCNIYFYFITYAVLNMQQAVLHGKCIAGAGLLR